MNLNRDPRITVLIETGADYGDLRGVMIKGHAELDASPERAMAVYLAVTRRMQGPGVTQEAVEAMFGRFKDKNSVVAIHPESVVSWDHRKGG